MTTYSAISNAALAVGAIPSSTTVTALRDNPIAIAEAASSAPIVSAGWHPPTKVTVGDGEAGLLYDFGVHGVQASVVTPDFVDGWEYRIFVSDLTHNNGTASRLQVNAYFQTDAIYRRVWFTPADFATQRFGVDIEFLMPRVSKCGHMFHAIGFTENTSSSVDSDDLENFFDTTAQKLLRAKIDFSAGSISGGKIWLMRRREYISSP